MFLHFWADFGIFEIIRKSPQNLCIDFKHIGPNSPQFSAILRKTCAKKHGKQLNKLAREIS